jgi:hypothetical protein
VEPLLNWPEGSLLVLVAVSKVGPQGPHTDATLDSMFVDPQPDFRDIGRGLLSRYAISRTGLTPRVGLPRYGITEAPERIDWSNQEEADHPRAMCRCVDYVCNDCDSSFI